MTTEISRQEHWMQKRWRPAMGWMYMSVCVFDFMLAPVMWSVLQSVTHGNVSAQWQPLTLQGAGLFHLAMGAVLGIAAFGRTQEKLGSTTPNGFGTNYAAPDMPMNTGRVGIFAQAPRATGPSQDFSLNEVAPGNYSRRAPMQPDQPEI